MGLGATESSLDTDLPEIPIAVDLRGTGPGNPLSPDRLIRRLVHDLRAPLRAMSVLPDWIREDAAGAGTTLPEDVLGHLTLIECQAQRMDGFLTGLQALCQLDEPGRLPVRVDLGEALARAAAETPVPAGFSLRISPAPNGPALAVRAVPEDLALMLRQLIGNAIHHHDRPDGRARLSLRRAVSNGIVEIADDGPGIAEADQARVFEPFTTVRPRDEVEGAGLGLAIAARVTAMLNGRIEILSRGRGTLVRMHLPLDTDVSLP